MSNFLAYGTRVYEGSEAASMETILQNSVKPSEIWRGTTVRQDYLAMSARDGKLLAFGTGRGRAILRSPENMRVAVVTDMPEGLKQTNYFRGEPDSAVLKRVNLQPGDIPPLVTVSGLILDDVKSIYQKFTEVLGVDPRTAESLDPKILKELLK